MSDTPTKTYPPSFLRALIADIEAEQAEATPEETTKRHDHRQSVWLVGDVLWCYQCGAWRQNAEGRHPWHKPTGIGGPNPCSTGTRREGTR